MTNKCLKSRILDKLRMLMNSNVKILDKRITLIKFQGCSSAGMSRASSRVADLSVNRDKGFFFQEIPVSQVTYDLAPFLLN